jgi:hypothetical protein
MVVIKLSCKVLSLSEFYGVPWNLCQLHMSVTNRGFWLSSSNFINVSSIKLSTLIRYVIPRTLVYERSFLFWFINRGYHYFWSDLSRILLFNFIKMNMDICYLWHCNLITNLHFFVLLFYEMPSFKKNISLC